MKKFMNQLVNYVPLNTGKRSVTFHSAEDTFALLDALEVDLEFIKGRGPNLALEIGYL
ncbi:hypothetical protein FS842_000080 [Serendipita sp. 407]|nr:hypothetical protein FS842_000080 [Serendipita sp. 407]